MEQVTDQVKSKPLSHSEAARHRPRENDYIDANLFARRFEITIDEFHRMLKVIDRLHDDTNVKIRSTRPTKVLRHTLKKGYVERVLNVTVYNFTFIDDVVTEQSLRSGTQKKECIMAIIAKYEDSDG